jgi:hypothetical protein
MYITKSKLCTIYATHYANTNTHLHKKVYTEVQHTESTSTSIDKGRVALNNEKRMESVCQEQETCITAGNTHEKDTHTVSLPFPMQPRAHIKTSVSWLQLTF